MRTPRVGARLPVLVWIHGGGFTSGSPADEQTDGLEWVRRNIAAFGGDPDRVTIGGHSADGGAMLTLLATEPAQHLFHRAVSRITPSTSRSGSTVSIDRGPWRHSGQTHRRRLPTRCTPR
ncbi:carboxylesterase family protein [Microbacterium sp.]|uniref:carboxylesterase family protein n=1 Tax=Microbacterium sp. TaxID=51671 RepID=UPI002810E106|nr:carboxylesterase family protein [Microbacterium sp.]